MRETAGSLRAYFRSVGAFVAGYAIWTIVDLGPGPLVLVFQGVSLLLGLALLITGVMAPKLVRTAPLVLFVALWVNFGWRTILTLFEVVAGLAKTMTYVDAVIALAIALYLSLNIRRLSKAAPLPGSDVLVQWQDGSHHPAVVVQIHDQQVEVRFANGQQQWVAVQYVSAC